MIKVTEAMVKDAINKVGQGSSLIYIPTWIRDEIAGILTTHIDPDWITYELKFENNEFEHGASGYPALIDVIDHVGIEGKLIDITVQHGNTDEPETVTVIGHTKCRYMQEVSIGEVPFPDFQGEERFIKVFLQEIEADGAGIGLAKTLNEIVAKTAKNDDADKGASTTVHVEINKNFEPAQTLLAGPGVAVSITPPLNEDYWMFRVKLFEDQAILGFPKHNTIGIGFAQEEDWNTNFPYTVDATLTYEHIKHNKKYDEITDEQCIEAIKAIQECEKAAKTAKA